MLLRQNPAKFAKPSLRMATVFLQTLQYNKFPRPKLKLEFR